MFRVAGHNFIAAIVRVIARKFKHGAKQQDMTFAWGRRELASVVNESYLPFQFGVRLLRKASIPSRKSSLI
jgi:hypothetical protein